MFSAAATIACTSTSGRTVATAAIAPSTAAAPPMSDFISPIPAAGLMHSPPESKVMPLPTNTIFLSFFFGT